jgi:spermidine/putrescine transport system substrate-binding protein
VFITTLRKINQKLVTVLIFSSSVLLLSCTQQKPESEKVVNLFIWPNYISTELLNKFHEKTHIKVNVSNFASNEELLAKLQAGATGYDVIVPSDYMISILIKSKLIKNIDKAQIPNWSKVDPKLLAHSFDPKNDFSLPYGWSTTGFAVNRKNFPDKISSWKELFENPKLKGKISILDDSREVFGAALKLSGESLNSTDLKKLTVAKDYLKAHKSQIKEFNSDPMEGLRSGDLWAAQMYSSDAFQLKYKNKMDVEYIIPDEGGTIAIDNLAIPESAKNVKEANELINFMLEEESNLSFVNSMYAGPVLTVTKSKLSKELQDNPSLFPPELKLSKLEALLDIGSATTEIDKLWTELKTSN